MNKILRLKIMVNNIYVQKNQKKLDYNGINPDKLFIALTLRLEPSGFK